LAATNLCVSVAVAHQLCNSLTDKKLPIYEWELGSLATH